MKTLQKGTQECTEGTLSRTIVPQLGSLISSQWPHLRIILRFASRYIDDWSAMNRHILFEVSHPSLKVDEDVMTSFHAISSLYCTRCVIQTSLESQGYLSVTCTSLFLVVKNRKCRWSANVVEFFIVQVSTEKNGLIKIICISPKILFSPFFGNYCESF